MCLLWIEVSVKYHKIRFCKYYMKSKRSSEEGSLKVQHGRTKCKSATETAAPWNVFFCGEKYICQKCHRTAPEITYSRGIPHTFSES